MSRTIAGRVKVVARTMMACLVAIPLAGSQSSDKPADTVATLVIKTMDQKYLYAGHSDWRAIRQTIATIDDPSPASAAAKVRMLLAKLHDSELHLATPDEVAAIQKEVAGRTIGSGLMEASTDFAPVTGDTRVVTPLVGSPAALAGLLPGDLIVKVNGRGTRDLDHEEVLDELRTHLQSTLVVRRGKHILTVRVTRSDEPLQAVSQQRLTAGTDRIGYIRIAQFTPDVADTFRSALLQLQSQGSTAYVIDLRNNPGGFLAAAAKIAGFFVSGHLGDKVTPDGRAEPINSDDQPLISAEAKIALLVNEGTASASEFLASAMQDRNRAVLVGAPTCGRGQAQIFQPLPDGYGLVVPSALLRTTSGRPYKGTGLSPDIFVASKPMADREPNPSHDPQLRRALEVVGKSGHAQ